MPTSTLPGSQLCWPALPFVRPTLFLLSLGPPAPPLPCVPGKPDAALVRFLYTKPGFACGGWAATVCPPPESLFKATSVLLNPSGVVKAAVPGPPFGGKSLGRPGPPAVGCPSTVEELAGGLLRSRSSLCRDAMRLSSVSPAVSSRLPWPAAGPKGIPLSGLGASSRYSLSSLASDFLSLLSSMDSVVTMPSLSRTLSANRTTDGLVKASRSAGVMCLYCLGLDCTGECPPLENSSLHCDLGAACSGLLAGESWCNGSAAAALGAILFFMPALLSLPVFEPLEPISRLWTLS
mmetsp:Transcript_600/g.2298  ORF Transcript_600/g.2298 Transcript_600/m.2298 type:complete len:292 (-) Transcript_600:1266-2141(-)